MENNTASLTALLDKSALIKLPDETHPLIIIPKEDIDVLEWASKYKDTIHENLLECGAILFRGFRLGSPDMFNRFFTALCGEPMEYRNRSSPREKVHNNVYTSTSHPADQRILLHTENSYSPIYNRIIAFYCSVPPESGGETPIADERRLMNYLGEDILQKFRKLRIQYVRNIFPDVGLNWQTIYQTDDKETVNRILTEQGVDYSWITTNQLRTKWVMSAFQRHPITHKELWFNHMYFGNKELYDPIVLEFFKEEDLPFSTYYGDGNQIELSVLNKISSYYADHSIIFKWEKDDFLLLENMMFAHGRHPFTGSRSILTAMGQPFSRDI